MVIDLLYSLVASFLLLYLYSWYGILKMTDYDAKVISHTIILKWTHLGIILSLSPVTYWAIKIWR